MTRQAFIPLILGIALALAGCASPATDNQGGENYGKRTPGMQVEDENIQDKIAENLVRNDARFRDAHINIDSYNGMVLLTGQVASDELKQKAGNIAEQVRRVRLVHNELQVAANSPLGQRMTDLWLTGRVKANLATDERIDGSRIRVITENSTTYLMGMVTHQEADIVTNIASQVGGIQRIVRVFEYLD
ncbi:BON domain-containing protein [Chromohalobacter sp. HP20-39]|uniref:BON domain-containing protein n=1 Tax=Chromohalobacter sp. HP20-39 TaxID=3079306 RepID=UPI00294AEC18|nr:BON domain-containing protein [Chromohalobacter sp. HP20-39]MDV6318916.1 BON domain-containing protein [Chromohalobacter sp. HP20-39]